MAVVTVMLEILNQSTVLESYCHLGSHEQLAQNEPELHCVETMPAP
jgi:hypothetical protein